MEIRKEENIVYQNFWLRVTEELFNDHTFVRAYADPSVHVIPMTEEGKVILIHENRHGEKETRWLLVSGGVEDMVPLEAAKAELAEEAGLSAENWELFMEKPYQGKAMNEHRYYYIATGLKSVDVENPDGDVVLETKAFSLDELKEKIFAGEFDWSPSVFPLLKLIQQKSKKTH